MAIEELPSQLRAISNSMSPGKKAGLFVFIAGVAALFVLIMFWAGAPDFQVLYSDLASEDASEILEKLQKDKIPYKISPGGNSISVPKELIYEMRLNLATKGLPRGGAVGFEIFDNSKLGMTEFVQNVNYQRALQGELARTINSFVEVKRTRIHLVLSSKSLFIEDEKPATASVVLTLRSGNRLTKEQVESIIHLVSSAIASLKPENVSVVDNYGRMLSGFGDGSASAKMNSDQLDYQQKVEKGIEDRVRSMLQNTLGSGKAIVRISCNFDFKREEKTQESYNPSNKVVRSEQLLNEKSNGSGNITSGIPGVMSNTSGGGKISSGAGNGTLFEKQDKTVNYEIGKITSRIIEPFGRIISMSVAVIIDGTYKKIAGKNGEEIIKYFPRTIEEMKKLENIVKRAVNINLERGDKIEIVNLPIQTAKNIKEEEILEKSWLEKLYDYEQLIKYGIFALFLLFIFLFVIRPMLKWITTRSQEDMEMLKQLPMTVGEMEKSIPYKDRAIDIINSEKSESIQVIQDWLKQEKI